MTDNSLEAFQKIYPSEFFKRFLVHSIRPDGRSLDKIRKTKLSLGSVRSSDGSAFVKIGNTSVVGSVVAEIATSSNPTLQGEIVVNVELTPICSPKFRPGRPPEQAQTVGYFLNSLLKSMNVVNLDKLTIGTDSNGKKSVWVLYVDLYCLNYDGNLNDACLLSLIGALKNTSIPSVKFDDDKYVLDSSSTKSKLEFNQLPFSLTFGVVEESLLVDMTGEEEELASSQVTIIMNESKQLLSILKSGGSAVSDSQLSKSINLASDRSAELISLLNSQNQDSIL